jgi:hypothetical protein
MSLHGPLASWGWASPSASGVNIIHATLYQTTESWSTQLVGLSGAASTRPLLPASFIIEISMRVVKLLVLTSAEFTYMPFFWLRNSGLSLASTSCIYGISLCGPMRGPKNKVINRCIRCWMLKAWLKVLYCGDPTHPSNWGMPANLQGVVHAADSNMFQIHWILRPSFQWLPFFSCAFCLTLVRSPTIRHRAFFPFHCACQLRNVIPRLFSWPSCLCSSLFSVYRERGIQ